MRDEGKAFCSDSWYLLAGVLFQKRHHNLPLKRNFHQAGIDGNGHLPPGHSLLQSSVEQQHEVVGDCSGLRHRYATTADGEANGVEDQMDELIKVMTALR